MCRPLADARIAVITGGASRERAFALRFGVSVLRSLERQGYGAERLDLAGSDFTERLRQFDVAFLAIAGQYAEDGKLQGLLETLRMPYTGSGVLASALAMDKLALKRFLRNSRICGSAMLDHLELRLDQSISATARKINDAIGFPVVVKPVSDGSSAGLSIVDQPDQLGPGLRLASPDGSARVYAERYCPGRSVTIGVLDGPVGPISLPVLEIEHAGRFNDWSSKYDPALHHYSCPATLEADLAERLSGMALAIHAVLGCIGLSRHDFVMDGDYRPFFLETNTLPGLAEDSAMSAMAAAGGISYDYLIEIILSSAFYRPRYVS